MKNAHAKGKEKTNNDIEAEYEARKQAIEDNYDTEREALEKALDDEMEAREQYWDDELDRLKDNLNSQIDSAKKAYEEKKKLAQKSYDNQIEALETLTYNNSNSSMDNHSKQVINNFNAPLQNIERVEDNADMTAAVSALERK